MGAPVMSTPTQREIDVAWAEAHQALLERNRLGVDIGVVPPEQQEHVYQAALARYRALVAQQEQQQ
jgi:hypothetical protein